MRRATLGLSAILLSAAALLWAQGQAPAPAQDVQEQLAIYRNLGKAFYENPTTQQQAVEQFRRALELAPDSVRERINYGMALLRAGQTEPGIAELLKAQQQDPAIPHTWFNLGIAYKKESEYDKAIAQFEQMVKLVPDEPVSHYNLGYLYRLTDKAELALQHFETAARLDPSLAAPHFQLYNAYRAAGRAEDAARELAAFQRIRQQQQGAAIPEDLDWSFYAEVYELIEPPPPPTADIEPRFEEARLADGFDPATAGLAVIDYNADRRADLLAWSKSGVRLFRNGLEEVPGAAGLGALREVRSVAQGDFNNDGFPDLVVLTDRGASLWVNQSGSFSRSSFTLPAGEFGKGVWVDYDHDYDLDLILLGADQKLARNNGAAGFSDLTSDFPFVSGNALDGVVMDLNPYENRFDLVVSYADRSGVVYHDRLGGKYESQPLASLPPGATRILARDWNHDGWTDLGLSTEAGIQPLYNRNGTLLPAESSDTPPVRWIEADFDGDGKTDSAVVSAAGALSLLQNVTPSSTAWTTVSLTGLKNLKMAMGARVEIKAGRLYQKQTYQGVPLTFGLGQNTQIDTIRITWPNGLIQNEVQQTANSHLHFTEAQRLSGSCPMIFTWNGQEFQFITDVLGVAPLGASAGDGNYFPVDHDEYIQIPAGALVETGGNYEVRITEELREVAYLDQVQLIAVDHPQDVEIYTNDKFKGPPFPEFRLFGVRRRVYPVFASDHRGADVLERLLRRDFAYPDGFDRDYSGVAEMHSLTLDFGDAAAENRAILVLNGWVDWADGSTFRAVSQESTTGLVMPYLQVRDSAGNWRTVIEDMGMPAGKPKTIVVDLTDRFLSSSRQVRIVTSLALYWDEIFLSEDPGAPEAVLTTLEASSAELRFRGFSRPVIHPERKQPERFDYQQWMPVSMWNPTPGLYTRYGDVRPLVLEADDQMIVMGSGDELRLLFPAGRLPALPPGWKREFLLRVDGWAKDQDANTAFGSTVEPLPFHGMSRYPYPEDERFLETEAHRRYRAEYNTRPALRLLRPLAEYSVRRGGQP